MNHTAKHIIIILVCAYGMAIIYELVKNPVNGTYLDELGALTLFIILVRSVMILISGKENE